MPRVLSIPDINGFIVEPKSSMNFLRSLIDKYLSWKDHINTVENKIANDIGLLYQGKHDLDDNCLDDK